MERYEKERRSVERELGGAINDLEANQLEEQGYFEDIELELSGAVGTAASIIRESRRQGQGQKSRSEPRSKAPASFAERLEVIDLLHAQLAAQEVGAFRDRLNLKLANPDEIVTAIEASHAGADGLALPWRLPDTRGLAAWIKGRWRKEWGLSRNAGGDKAQQAIADYRHSSGSLEELHYRDGQSVQILSVKSSNALGMIAVEATRLAERWCWEHHEATRFAVCDSRPAPHVWYAMSRPRIVQVGTGSRRSDSSTRLELVLDPELTPEDVAAIYARARVRILPQDKERLRPLSPKAIGLARLFIEGEALGWRQLLERWNNGVGQTYGGYPETTVGLSNFQRDVRKARTRIARRGWRVR